jgi:hypothetical protein
VVVLADVAHEFSLRVGHRCKHASREHIPRDLAKPEFDLVKQNTAARTGAFIDKPNDIGGLGFEKSGSLEAM